jgi:hypothetical protein
MPTFARRHSRVAKRPLGFSGDSQERAEDPRVGGSVAELPKISCG